MKCCLNQSGNMQMPILIIFVETLVEFPNLIIHSKTRRVLTSTPKTVAAEWRNEDTLCCLATSADNNRELIQYRTSTGTYSPDWTYIFLCGLYTLSFCRQGQMVLNGSLFLRKNWIKTLIGIKFLKQLLVKMKQILWTRYVSYLCFVQFITKLIILLEKLLLSGWLNISTSVN